MTPHRASLEDLKHIQDALDFFAKKNWSSMPLAPDTKRPFKGNGKNHVKFAKWKDEAVHNLESWLKVSNGSTVIGLPIPFDIVVIDLDLGEGKPTLEEHWKFLAQGDIYPGQTLTVRTPSGGLHLFFRLKGSHNYKPSTPIKNTIGVDFLTHRRYYSVAAGSLTNDGEYFWNDPDVDIAYLPQKFIDAHIDALYDPIDIAEIDRKSTIKNERSEVLNSIFSEVTGDYDKKLAKTLVQRLSKARPGSRKKILLIVATKAKGASIPAKVFVKTALALGLKMSDFVRIWEQAIIGDGSMPEKYESAMVEWLQQPLPELTKKQQDVYLAILEEVEKRKSTTVSLSREMLKEKADVSITCVDKTTLELHYKGVLFQVEPGVRGEQSKTAAKYVLAINGEALDSQYSHLPKCWCGCPIVAEEATKCARCTGAHRKLSDSFTKKLRQAGTGRHIAEIEASFGITSNSIKHLSTTEETASNQISEIKPLNEALIQVNQVNMELAKGEEVLLTSVKMDAPRSLKKINTGFCYERCPNCDSFGYYSRTQLCTKCARSTKCPGVNKEPCVGGPAYPEGIPFVEPHLGYCSPCLRTRNQNDW